MKTTLKIAGVCLAALVAGWGDANAIETKAKNAIIVDHSTGVTLYSKGADEVIYPASMTKMMTAYLMFEALKSGEISADTTYPVSEEAWRKGGSKMFVELGSDIPVADLMRGVVIQSGNDACIVFAQGFAGSEERFAQRMTLKAKELGMEKTVFKNATGWPDETHVTTARDLATLAEAIVSDFPQYYPVYSEREYTYNDIRQYNRNLLLGRKIGVDGLKTGHTEAAGYGITVSGEQEGRRVHVVVGGLGSERERADEVEKLYRYAYAEFDHFRPGNQQVVIAQVPLWYGAKDQVDVVMAQGDALVLPTIEQERVKAEIVYDASLKAPIEQGQRIGVLQVTSAQMSQQQVPVYAGQTVEKASFVKRWVTNLMQLFGGA